MNYSKFAAASTGIAFALMVAAPALADENVNTSADASVEAHSGFGIRLPFLNFNGSTTVHKEGDREREDDHATSTQKRIEKGQERGENMIDARIKSLDKLLERIGKMKLLSASDIASIQASINAEIKILTDLKAKIVADISTSTVKADDSSITKANRVYLVVMPKAQIAAAASRIKAVATQMEEFSTKLATRITTAKDAGVDVSSATTALADFNAKVADAKVQADAAVALTVNLEADNGDAAVRASNLAALKSARTKLQAAVQDLAAARKDAGTIYGVVKGKGSVNITP